MILYNPPEGSISVPQEYICKEVCTLRFSHDPETATLNFPFYNLYFKYIIGSSKFIFTMTGQNINPVSHISNFVPYICTCGRDYGKSVRHDCWLKQVDWAFTMVRVTYVTQIYYRTTFFQCTVFIQIDDHALIHAHPLHCQAPEKQKWVKLMNFVSKIHRSMMILM